MKEPKIIGWCIVDVRNPTKVLKTGEYRHRTAKVYSSLGTAKAAVRNSAYRSLMEEGFIRFFPILILEKD